MSKKKSQQIPQLELSISVYYFEVRFTLLCKTIKLITMKIFTFSFSLTNKRKKFSLKISSIKINN